MESEIYSGAPLVEPPLYQRCRKKTWSELREVVREIRLQLYHTAFKTPTNVVFSKKNGGVRIYFLCSFATCRQVTLHYVDVSDDGELSPCQTLLESKFTSEQTHSSSKEEQLRMERKRFFVWGITSFNYVDDGYFVFNSSGSVYRCADNLPLGSAEKGLLPTELRGQTKWQRLDPQLSPSNPALVAYVADSDVWVFNCSTETEIRLTKVHEMATTLSAGTPCYVTQEEFKRFSGLWWSPKSPDDVYSILYEVVDESNVEVIDLPNATGGVEEFRFPRAGTANAKSSLRIVSFKLNEDGTFTSIRHRYLVNPYIYGAEYLLRAGWTDDGQYVWTEVLNRQQDILQVLLMKVPPVDSNICDIVNDSTSQEDGLITKVMLVLEEKSSVWINVDDVLHFIDVDENFIELLWASEFTGYRHLYLYKIGKESGTCLRKTQLTSGDWEVKDEIWVDSKKRIVYFIGLKDTPLETHLYVVSLDSPNEIQRLTKPGASHQAFLSIRMGLAIIIESSLSQPAHTRLFRLPSSQEADGILPMCVDAEDSVFRQPNSPVSCSLVGNIMEPSSIGDSYRIPEFFSHQLNSGDTVYGLIFKPRSLDILRPQKFPTVLAIYGGPEVQLVTNSFKGMRNLRHHLLSSEDFCVVTMDCRGSGNRGVAFQSHLRGRMGQVEIQDQVEVLQWLAEDRGYIDMNRVAIHGWSYGGYLSLMGLAQRPDVFKLAIAGAPVTQWNLYDTGYTERYMGLPDSNREGYHRGSVLSYVSQFPDDENRLLIIHGLMDENVHFSHTTSLIESLVKAGKPYRLQVYPQERHSLRHLATSEHYETTLLSFIQEHL